MSTDDANLTHIGLIPDGNRRWAEQTANSLEYAYNRGGERVREALDTARDEYGIANATVWCLSTENWRRPPEELDLLVTIFSRLIDEYIDQADEHGRRIVHLGRKGGLPGALVERLVEVQEVTRYNDRGVLNLALDYGGGDEVRRACGGLLLDALAGTLDPACIAEITRTGTVPATAFAARLDTGGQRDPEPDLVVRTSGELRLSGFMPMQTAYSELYFAECLWPDFDAHELNKAITSYHSRQRRFGGDG